MTHDLIPWEMGLCPDCGMLESACQCDDETITGVCYDCGDPNCWGDCCEEDDDG